MCSMFIGDQAIVKLLIENGSDVNAENINGETPIFMAARNGMLKQKFGIVESQ